MVTSPRGCSGVHGLDGAPASAPGRLGFVQLQTLRTSSRVKGGGGGGAAGASWNPASLPALHFRDSWLPDHTVALVLGWPLATLTWTLRAGSAGAGPWEQRPHPPTGGERVPEGRTCRRPQRPRGRLWGGAGGSEVWVRGGGVLCNLWESGPAVDPGKLCPRRDLGPIPPAIRLPGVTRPWRSVQPRWGDGGLEQTWWTGAWTSPPKPGGGKGVGWEAGSGALGTPGPKCGADRALGR